MSMCQFLDCHLLAICDFQRAAHAYHGWSCLGWVPALLVPARDSWSTFCGRCRRCGNFTQKFEAFLCSMVFWNSAAPPWGEHQKQDRGSIRKLDRYYNHQENKSSTSKLNLSVQFKNKFHVGLPVLKRFPWNDESRWVCWRIFCWSWESYNLDPCNIF